MKKFQQKSTLTNCFSSSEEPESVDLSNYKGLNIVKALHPEVYSIMNYLQNKMIYLTVELEKKPLNNINKQFQDCIMNYFFEDFVGDLIKEKFPHQTKTQIKDRFFSEMTLNKKSDSSKKYMIFPQLYLSEIKKQQKEEAYVNLLVSLALEEIRFLEEGPRWRSQIRKKCFSVILLVHFYNDAPVQTIFDMWENAFPENPIKNKKQSPIKQTPNQQKKSDCKLIIQDIKEPKPSKKFQYNHYFKNFSSQLNYSNLLPEFFDSSSTSSTLQMKQPIEKVNKVSSPLTDSKDQQSQSLETKHHFLSSTDCSQQQYLLDSSNEQISNSLLYLSVEIEYQAQSSQYDEQQQLMINNSEQNVDSAWGCYDNESLENISLGQLYQSEQDSSEQSNPYSIHHSSTLIFSNSLNESNSINGESIINQMNNSSIQKIPMSLYNDHQRNPLFI